MPIVTDYTALLSGSYWGGIETAGKPTIVTFSFPAASPGYLAGIGGFTPATLASFQAFSAAEQAQALAALGEWSSASGIVFVQVGAGQGDINFQLVDLQTTASPSYAGAGGIGFYPFGDWNFATYPSFRSDLDASGDVFMNSAFQTGSGAAATVSYETLLHEIGHAIGLKHPTEVVFDFAASPFVTHDQVLASDDPSLTIMATIGGGTGHLTALDQAAAAHIYGAEIAGKPDVITASAAATYNITQNAAVASWSWNAATETLMQTGRSSNDTIRGISVADVINGGNGDDHLFGLNGNDTLNGGNGNDVLDGGPGADRMVGGAGDDAYHIDSAGDVAVEAANSGFDAVFATVDYSLSNNMEFLQLFGAGLTGQGNNAANSIFGDGMQSSSLFGKGGDDYMVGGAATDDLHGGNDNDTMFAGGGDDTVFGDNGNDWLYGEAGIDRLNGGAGNDVIDGGAGKDVLTGGTGADQFVFADAIGPTSYDRITDFAVGVDKLVLAASIFAAVGPTLDVGELGFGAAASSPSHRILYDGSNGNLLYDADGQGGAAAIRFAIVGTGLALQASDFLVL